MELDTTPALKVTESNGKKLTVIDGKTYVLKEFTEKEKKVGIEKHTTSITLDKSKYDLLRDVAWGRQSRGEDNDTINDVFRDAIDTFLEVHEITRDNTPKTPLDAKFRKGRKAEPKDEEQPAV